MPRRPRILLTDHPLHIVQRGINRERCLFAGDTAKNHGSKIIVSALRCLAEQIFPQGRIAWNRARVRARAAA
jgi:hypothetical protein